MDQFDSGYNFALKKVIELCDKEAKLYQENAVKCDASGNHIGGYGDMQSAATAKYIREKVRELLIKD